MLLLLPPELHLEISHYLSEDDLLWLTLSVTSSTCAFPVYVGLCHYGRLLIAAMLTNIPLMQLHQLLMLLPPTAVTATAENNFVPPYPSTKKLTAMKYGPSVDWIPIQFLERMPPFGPAPIAASHGDIHRLQALLAHVGAVPRGTLHYAVLYRQVHVVSYLLPYHTVEEVWHGAGTAAVLSAMRPTSTGEDIVAMVGMLHTAAPLACGSLRSLEKVCRYVETFGLITGFDELQRMIAAGLRELT